RKFRVVYYDQRGSLRSPAPLKAISVAAHVADLETLRAELGVDRIHLVGHSMGTALALCYLAAHPDRVGRLVLVAPVNPGPFELDERTRLEVECRGKAFWARRQRAAEVEARRHGLNQPEDLGARD